MLSLPLRRERSGQFVILGTIGCLCGMFYRFTADALPFIGTGLINIKKKKKIIMASYALPSSPPGEVGTICHLRHYRVASWHVLSLYC